MLEVIDVSKSYPAPGGSLPVLRGVSLGLEAGRSLALTGESGSGKSTLLHLVAGLDSADGGAIRVGGAEVTGAGDAARARLRRETIGLVFQQFNLIRASMSRPILPFRPALPGGTTRPGRRTSSSGWGSARCFRAIPNSSRAGSSSGWRSAARSGPGRG